MSEKRKILFYGLTENSAVRGVERYSLELLRALSEHSSLDITLIRGPWQIYYDGLAGVKIINFRWSQSKLSRHLWALFVLPFLAQHYDLVHVNNTMPIFFKIGKPFIFTIHDLAEYYVPEKYSFSQRCYRKLVLRVISLVADGIITVSDFSKTSITDILKPSCPIESIYPGLEHLRYLKTAEGDSTLLKYVDVSPPFLFYWSVLERSKGILEAITGFLKYQKDFGDFNCKLLVAGKPGNAWDDVVGFFENPNIIYLGEISDTDLKSLCQRAAGILFPSKFEGFGFPPLEGFIYCDNIIASNTTSVGEVTKDFAFQVDAGSSEEFSEAINSIFKTPRYFSEIQRDQILRKYSWARCASSTSHFYFKYMASC
jgi:glycosyltransferase involved in cell wall biosynthesis